MVDMKRIFGNAGLIFLILSVIILNSCKDPGEEERDNERKLIQAYLAEKNITVEPTSSGLYYVEKEVGTGKSPVNGEFVKVMYTMKMVENEHILSTTDSTIASANETYNPNKLYGPEVLQIGNVIRGLDEGLKKMKIGGKAQLIFSSDLGWGSTYGTVPPYTSLIIDVTLDTIIPDLENYERQLLNQFIISKGFELSDSLASGVYLLPVEEGSGDTVKNFGSVNTKIRATLSDGRVFMEYDSIRWEPGTDITSKFTNGLHEGVVLMRENESAIIVVPYYKGYYYGIYVYEGKRKTPIPPFATLYYEVKVLDVK
jgi:FKBP-type peptidyl-prolyl cis-trans isomerase